MKTKCEGCGIKIQTTNPLMPGYIDPDVYMKNPDNFLCQRCYNLKHHNIPSNTKIDEKKFYENIKKISETDALIVYLVDAFDLEGTFLDNINELFPNQKILMVVNKFDLFLSSTKVMKVKNYILSLLKEKNIKTSSVQVISSKSDKDVMRVFNEILRLRGDSDVYVFGMTNVGKSTFINALTRLTLDKATDITTSNLPSTTLDLIKIPVGGKAYLYDMPGIINPHQMTYYLDKETINKVLPKKFIKPKVFQLNPGQTVFIGGFAMISFISGEKASFVANFSNELVIHRTKLINKDEFYENHKDDILLLPNKGERERLGKMVSHAFSVDGKCDICISGLGFMTIHGMGSVTIETFEQIKVSMRESLI